MSCCMPTANSSADVLIYFVCCFQRVSYVMKKPSALLGEIFVSGHLYTYYINNVFLISVFLDACLLNERANLE